jgi:Flp pilus assembly pilin Flp
MTRPVTGDPARRKKKRRGATSLEYVFAISLIFIVCIAAVQHLGSVTKDSIKSSQQKIEKKGKK